MRQLLKGLLLLTIGLLSLPLQAEDTASQAMELAEVLEDPVARERLIEQLRLLAQAQTQENQVKSATAALLEGLSDQLASFGKGLSTLASSIEALPSLFRWMVVQVRDPERRALWGEVLFNLFLVLGLGYGAFFIARVALRRPYRYLAARRPAPLWQRGVALTGLLALDLLAIAAFAAAALITLSLLSIREETRLVALAWVNASILVRLVLALGRFFFAPQAPGLRLLPMGDETAHYAQIWVRRLAFIGIYGYFALEAAFLLGLPAAIHMALLRILGLILAALSIVLVWQNREAVARLIQGPSWRGRIAHIWHLPASLYILLFYGVWALAIPGGFGFIAKGSLLTLAVLAIGILCLKGMDALFSRGLRISEVLRARFPDLEARVNRYFPVLHRAARGLVYALMFLAVLQAWGLEVFDVLLSEPGRVIGETALSVTLILVLSLVLWEAVNGYIQARLGGVEGVSARTRTLLTVSRNAFRVVLFTLAGLLVLSELGFNITPLLAGAGVVGLAVGFGSQKLVQDVITGAFILFEDLFSVGDVIKVNDKAGLVERVTIRNVRLRDLSGTVHTIPFSAISTISNLTKDFSYFVFDLGVAYKEDVDRVMEVIEEVGAKLQKDPDTAPLILEPVEILGVDAFADSAVVIKGRIKTYPIKQWTVGRAFNRLIKKRFDELGIEIPFPHRTLYFGEGIQVALSPSPGPGDPHDMKSAPGDRSPRA